MSWHDWEHGTDFLYRIRVEARGRSVTLNPKPIGHRTRSPRSRPHPPAPEIVGRRVNGSSTTHPAIKFGACPGCGGIVCLGVEGGILENWGEMGG